MPKTRTVAVFMMALSFLTLGLAAPALAAPAIAHPLASETEEVRQFLEIHGVDVHTQDTLLDALASGEVWDSMSPEELPVSTRSEVTTTSTLTIDTFADGSIVVAEIESPRAESGDLGARTVTGCRTTVSGTGYSNRYDCKASASTGLVLMGFYISYSLTGSWDSIIEVHSPYGQCSLGTCTSPTLSVQKYTENASGSAWARSRMTFTGAMGTGGGTYEMRALVGGNTAWTRWELKGIE